MKRIVLIIAVISFSLSGNAQISNEIQKIAAADREIDDYFGEDIAVSGNYAIITAMGNDLDASGSNFIEEAGAAYVFEKDSNGNWNQIQKLVASDRTEIAQFGASVSIHGTTAIIGARSDSYDSSGGNQVDFAGAAYIFNRESNGTWTQTHKIVTLDRSVSARFGSDVVIQGNVAIIGAPLDKFDLTGGNELLSAGSVYYFVKDSNGQWNQAQKLISSSRDAFDEFGGSIALDNNTLVVGSNWDDEFFAFGSGSAYVFEKDSNGQWNETQGLFSDDLYSGDHFGIAVSIDNGTILIGARGQELDSNGMNTLQKAGAAYIFENNGSSWIQQQKLVPTNRFSFASFGFSLQLSGSNAIIGARAINGDPSQSEDAFLFVKNGNSWAETDQFQASDRAQNDLFGKAVALSGSTIMVSAHYQDLDENGNNSKQRAGAAYFFESTNLGISDLNLQSKIKFFPNPTPGVITINLDNSISEINTTITNTLGQIIASEKFVNTNSLQLKIEGSTGIYFVNVTTSEGLSETIKVIKN